MQKNIVERIRQSYEEVPYHSHPFPQTAPEHLEAVALLFGLATQAPANARVLELGCASGGNLLPFAARHPGAQVVGVDLSAAQIAEGERAIAHAGLKNITLHNLDLAQIGASFGEFDYIVCHGVYSWVPPEVQQAILRIASQNLAPKGVAYISYNTYPGWKAREIVRDAMLLRGEGRGTPAERLAYARGMVEFLHGMARPGSVLHKALEEVLPTIQSNKQDYYVLHEFLEDCNAPCYFKDFVAAAEGHGLTYLAEAEPSSMFVSNYGAAVAGPLLKECGDSQVKMEQYLDFQVNRQFRQTILVKKARENDIRYQLDDNCLRQLEYAAHFHSDTALTLDDNPQPCKGWRDVTLMLRTPLHKAVCLVLSTNYPSTTNVPALASAAGKLLQQTAAQVMPNLLLLLSELLVQGAVRFRHTPVSVAAKVPPMARALPAVLQDEPHGGARACNAWHDNVSLDVLQRALLPRLDAQHDMEKLAAHLLNEATSGRIQFMREGKVLTTEADMQRSARDQLPGALEALRRAALLI